MILLARHMPTTYTKDKLILSHTDVDVVGMKFNDRVEFRERVAMARQRHRTEPTLATRLNVHCSPLIRTQSTAKLMGFSPFNILHDAREYDLGDYDGTSGEAFRKLDEQPKGIEPLSYVRTRCRRLLMMLNSMPDDQLLFTHGMLMRVILDMSMTDEFRAETAPQLMRRYTIPTLSVIKFDKDGNVSTYGGIVSNKLSEAA